MKNGELSELQMFRTETKSFSKQIKFIKFFTPEKRQKSDSNVGEEVESPKTSPNLPTSIDSKHRKSGFDPAWLKDFSWLQTNNDVNGSNSGMMCKLCRKHNQRGQKVRQVVESKTENDSRLRKSS